MRCHYRSQDSSVHMVTGLLLGRSGVTSQAEAKDFSFLQTVQRDSMARPIDCLTGFFTESKATVTGS
jgi:hypothetical protein